jgi:hypothetical protein
VEVWLDGSFFGWYLAEDTGDVGVPNCSFVETTINIPAGLLPEGITHSLRIQKSLASDDIAFHDVTICWPFCGVVDPACCPVPVSTPVPAPKDDGTFVVDIEITNTGAIEAFGFDLTYDETRLLVVDVLRSPFTQVCPSPGDPGCFDSFFWFEPSAGVVRIGGFSASGPETPGSPELLCQVVFRPTDPNQASDLLLTTNFTDDFAGYPPCEGTVTFLPEGTGDVNDNGSLTPGDALCAFRCWLSDGDIAVDPFSQCDLPVFDLEAVRSDVNCDGNCTPGDAQNIQERWGLGCGGPEHCFGKDGDPCNVPHPGGVSGVLRTAPRVERLRLGAAVVTRGEVARVPLQIRGTGELEMFGLDLLPSSGLEVIALEPANASADWAGFGAGLGIPGLVRIGAFGGAMALSPSEWKDLGYLVVRARSDAASVENLDVLEGHENLEHIRTIDGRIEIQEGTTALPGQFALGIGRPNPSSGNVSIDYAIPTGEAQRVEIKVYNLHGQVVKTLVDRVHDAGRHEVIWDGLDQTGQRVASGTYFYRMSADSFEKTRKIVRIRTQ